MANTSSINKVIDQFFKANPGINKVQAKELMPLFTKAGFFPSNQKDDLLQRKRYDKRKRSILPVHGIAEVDVFYYELPVNGIAN